MVSEWKNFKLADKCTVKSSKRIFAREYVESGIPFFRSKDVIDKSLGSFSSYDLFISETRYLEIKNKFGSPQKGDLLINSVGNRSGQPYVVQDEGDFYFKDGNILWLSGFSEIDVCFLSYWLKSDLGQWTLESVMIGSAQKALTIDAIRNLEIKFPTLPEQKAIAHVLGALDDRIVLNRRMNDTLVGMAQALFKSWFVDFDPVIDNALALGKDIPESLRERAATRAALGDKRQPLSEEIRTLFPDEFIESAELGWIPKGWEVKSFGDFIKTTIGGDWGKESEDERHTVKATIIRGTDIPHLKSGSLSAAPSRWVEIKKLKTRQLEDGDIVIEVSGGSPKQPTGRALYVTNNLIARLGNTIEPASFCRKLRPNTKSEGLYAAIHLDRIYGLGKMWEYQNQSTGISNFQTKVFLSSEMVITPGESYILDYFYEQVRPLMDKATSNQQIALAKLRDTLLPKLLSGEIRIPDAEKMVEGLT